ncbi:phage N-6-adenine-methyltransferase [Ferrimonas balearica]|uniref:phage N-6-adenine-methyltransferase n=1 Tax=Ferrimonas balearica TaxID=44012 RepID=UPI001C951A53|nr:phage N-6-adenine-methyltransferase [Ferrimonas balearica]MBY6104978.1 phage N-6-adenine-methyltransferase [Ferrimonas balearica]
MAIERTKEQRDAWATPASIFMALQRLYPGETPGFGLDAAASAHNAKVPDNYLTKAHNSLDCDWKAALKPGTNWVWVNPPYSCAKLFVEKAKQEHKRGVSVVMLLNQVFDTGYFAEAECTEVLVVTDGRIRFVCDVTGELGDNPSKGNAAFIWRAHWPGTKQPPTHYFTKEELEAIGRSAAGIQYQTATQTR